MYAVQTFRTWIFKECFKNVGKTNVGIPNILKMYAIQTFGTEIFEKCLKNVCKTNFLVI